MGSAGGGLIAAIFLLVLGFLLISGILNFILWLLGAICIVAGLIAGAVALVSLFGRKNRYDRL